jgi:hypothetical protein
MADKAAGILHVDANKSTHGTLNLDDSIAISQTLAHVRSHTVKYKVLYKARDVQTAHSAFVHFNAPN